MPLAVVDVDRARLFRGEHDIGKVILREDDLRLAVLERRAFTRALAPTDSTHLEIEHVIDVIVGKASQNSRGWC